MYRTYALLKDHFLERMRLLYTDTDSFILKMDGEDLYKEILETRRSTRSSTSPTCPRDTQAASTTRTTRMPLASATSRARRR